MKGKYTHKYVIYNKKRIRENFDNLVLKLAEFESEAIPFDFLEVLNEESELFRKKRKEFYHKNPSKMCTIDEILPINEETNIKANKVLAFVYKNWEFSELIAAVDYFDGEDEYVEKYFPVSDAMYFGGSKRLPAKFTVGYFYGVDGNELDVLLKDMDLEYLI